MRITIIWPGDEYHAMPFAKRATFERSRTTFPVVIDGAPVARLPLFGEVAVDLAPGSTVRVATGFPQSNTLRYEDIDPARPLVFVHLLFGRPATWRERGLAALAFVGAVAVFLLLPQEIIQTDAFGMAVVAAMLTGTAAWIAWPGRTAMLSQA